MKPRLIELACCAGGATRGYQLAGFHVTGIDIHPQPNYVGDEFIQADMLDILADRAYLESFVAAHASPPCQKWTPLGGADHPDLLTPTLAAFRHLSIPWVVENVPRAPFGDVFTTMLCGSMFGLRVRRHRLFASNVLLLAPSSCRHSEQGQPLGVYGQLTNPIHSDRPQRGVKAQGLAEASAAMGIDWMSREELVEALPPAYCEHLGAQLLTHLAAAA